MDRCVIEAHKKALLEEYLPLFESEDKNIGVKWTEKIDNDKYGITLTMVLFDEKTNRPIKEKSITIAELYG